MSFERNNIKNMQGYASGEQPEDTRTIKLNTNENPYSPSPTINEVLSQIDTQALRRYPPATAATFRQLAAELHGLGPENIIATRGGDELLRLVITTFVDPGAAIGMTNPTYSLYEVLAQIQDCPTISVDLKPDWSLPDDFARRMNDASVKLTLLVNPHAPSGNLIDIEQIDAIAGELDSILLLDEAYIDFVSHRYDSTQLLADHDNIIILRTLSKGYSLAGLRFGYGIAQASLIDPMMSKTRDSYNLDMISQQIAEAAIHDQEHARSTWLKVIDERNRIQRELAQLGLKSPASQANFLLVTVPAGQNRSAEQIYQMLKERHILVRYFSADGLTDKLRISIGKPDENNQLLDTLKDILQ
jgi:histidinol-phosphate aminotransferase